MAGHTMYEDHGLLVGVLDTTITHPGPLHTEELVATFSCGLLSNKCCLSGGYETLYIDGINAPWPTRPERTCNTGRESNDQCGA
jgi:hypothetical protein